MPLPTEINGALISALSTIITAIAAAIVRAIEKTRFEKRLRNELSKPKQADECTTTTEPAN